MSMRNHSGARGGAPNASIIWPFSYSRWATKTIRKTGHRILCLYINCICLHKYTFLILMWFWWNTSSALWIKYLRKSIPRIDPGWRCRNPKCTTQSMSFEQQHVIIRCQVLALIKNAEGKVTCSAKGLPSKWRGVCWLCTTASANFLIEHKVRAEVQWFS